MFDTVRGGNTAVDGDEQTALSAWRHVEVRWHPCAQASVLGPAVVGGADDDEQAMAALGR